MHIFICFRIQTVAIIGGDVSGLISIKCCLDDDLLPTCYEMTNDIGGLWNYDANAIDGKASVMKSTEVNTSKEFMAFNDFPPSADYSNYMHNAKLLSYFHLTASFCHFSQSEKLHSWQYKTSHGYEDKTVLIIGIGSSADDMAVELGHVAKQSQTESSSFTYSILEQHPFINDNLPNRIITDSVIIKLNVKEFTSDGHDVIFDDAIRIDHIDCVLMATGFNISFPYLNEFYSIYQR
ncbi:unnamed protein product [Rotaria sp. Silwood2]|nr:unnamed protein product [Rotaria sp. Silwood2]